MNLRDFAWRVWKVARDSEPFLTPFDTASTMSNERYDAREREVFEAWWAAHGDECAREHR